MLILCLHMTLIKLYLSYLCNLYEVFMHSPDGGKANSKNGWLGLKKLIPLRALVKVVNLT